MEPEIKTYTIQLLKKVGEPDDYKNVPYSIKFAEEVDNVFWKTKKRVAEGQTVSGYIEDAEGRSGKSYRKFVFKMPEGAANSSPQSPPRGMKKDQDIIRAQWAIGQSMVKYISTVPYQNAEALNGWATQVEDDARILFDMSERIKNHEPTPTQKVAEITGGEEIEDVEELAEGQLFPNG